MEALQAGFAEFALAAAQQFLNVSLLAVFVLAGYLLGRAIQGAQNMVVRRRPTSGQQLAGKAIVVLATLFGFSIGLTFIYEANLGAIAASLGVASLALGFGLQHTVANLAAGVSLSVDKPFEVGDRIQVGENWGDVVSIGLRSTLIRVTGGQTVSIPNAMLDTREVWNSTFAGNKWLRLQLPFTISYASSVALAESLCLKVARSRSEVMAYPPPQVRMMHLGDNGVELQLRCWISHAQERAWVTDRLLRGIKESFDEAGVQFPFPQRTVHYAKDDPTPAPTPTQLAGIEEPHGKILVVARTHATASRMARPIVEFASRVGASIVVLHVRPTYQVHDTTDGENVLNEYLSAAQAANVKASGRLELGTPAEVVRRVAKEEGVSLVLLGHGIDKAWVNWKQAEVQIIKKTCPVPLVAMEARQLLRDEVVDHWKAKLAPSAEAPKGPPPTPAKPKTG